MTTLPSSLTNFPNGVTARSMEIGPTSGYGILAAGSQLFVSGTAGLILNLPETAIPSDIALAAHRTSDDTDTLISTITGNGILTITNSADPLAAHSAQFAIIRNKCFPTYDIFAAGTATTVGGSTAEAITVTGAVASDIALVCYAATNDTDTIVKAVMTANTLTVTMSADPIAAHALHYCILRPNGSFVPTHYIFAAGSGAATTGSATQTIAVAGALVTDVAMVNYAATDDTDTILKSVVTANTLTVTLSADPLAAHSLSYMILRKYPS